MKRLSVILAFGFALALFWQPEAASGWGWHGRHHGGFHHGHFHGGFRHGHHHPGFRAGFRAGFRQFGLVPHHLGFHSDAGSRFHPRFHPKFHPRFHHPGFHRGHGWRR